MKFEPMPWSFRQPGQHPPIQHLAVLGNFPPRRCGLASYTYDSIEALRLHPSQPVVDIYVMDDDSIENYSDEVTMLLEDGKIDAYIAAADAINKSDAEMLWIQHEFGIFGGEAGSHLLALLNRVDVPVAITLHTILDSPSPAQRSVLQALCDRAVSIIVMARRGKEILLENYHIDGEKISVIPHGVPDRPMTSPRVAREILGLADRPSVLTFGLLAPDKGIEDMIEAMPVVLATVPDAHYVVLGATHPNLLKNGADPYRQKLLARIASLGLGDAVTLIDRFVSLDELVQWLAAADVYVTP
jgi:glycosyltransferase involved in cell wall biosynthesis